MVLLIMILDFTKLAPMTVAAALENPFDLLTPAFAQRALIAVLVLAAVSAAVGWAIVLRDLPFFAHAIGAGAYPVLVLGVIVGASIAVSALGGAVLFALVLAALAGIGRGVNRRADSGRRDTLIGLAVAAALAAGAVLAARAGSGHARLAVSPEALLFGSLLTVDGATLAVLAGVAAAVLVVAWFARDRWLAAGFDPAVAGQLASARSDFLLLACVALAAGTSLPVTGSLLAGALLIVPAATARMLTERAMRIPVYSFALAGFAGIAGLYLSLNFDLPTGAAIAAVAGGMFFVAAGIKAIASARGAYRPAVSLAVIAMLALAVTGCGSNDSAGGTAKSETLAVAATTPQVADIVKQVGGDAVEVTTLLPPGADPHEYEPKPSTIAAISDAGVTFRSGGDIDAWLLPAVKAAGPETPPVDLSRAAVLIPGEAEGTTNAHWYLDPQNVARAAQRVRDELIKADPSARETFRTNATEYLDQISSADAKLTACAKKIPAGDRNLMSGHDDFNYLANAFGLKIAAQIAASGEAEPSASELQKAVDSARAAKVRAVVASRGEVSQLDKQVAAKIGVPLLALYADSLTTGDDASTLLGAISYDVGRIADAVTDGNVKCGSTL